MTPTLSILIRTLETRSDLLQKVMDGLDAQQGRDRVQVLVSRDNGAATRGAKCQSLIERATGDFVVFRDDDDEVPEDYIPTILEACKEGVDCIGYEFACYGYHKSGKMELAAVSNKYRHWASNVAGYAYVRHTHHLVPVRREHALRAGFDVNKDHGEDYAYSMRLRDLRILKNEVFIRRPMYIVRFNPNKKPGE